MLLKQRIDPIYPILSAQKPIQMYFLITLKLCITVSDRKML